MFVRCACIAGCVCVGRFGWMRRFGDRRGRRSAGLLGLDKRLFRGVGIR